MKALNIFIRGWAKWKP